MEDIPMARKYYTLFTRSELGGWFPQFGDYVRSVVVDEAADSYEDDVCKIVRHDDTKAGLEAAQASLNALSDAISDGVRDIPLLGD